MNFKKLLKKQDYVTLLNVISGSFSIFFSVLHLLNLAAGFMLLSVLFDYLDGKVARKGTTHLFGKQLDSLADLVSFGISPAVFAFIISSETIMFIPVWIFFIACGVLRLARFNTLNIKEYIGMPITFNGIIIPLVYFLRTPVTIYPIIYLISSLLMISNIKIKKLI